MTSDRTLAFGLLLALLFAAGSAGAVSTRAAVRRIGSKKRATPEERNVVLKAFEDRGFPRDEANALIWLESGWKPHALNSLGYAGLNQMGADTLRALGFQGTTEDYADLSAAEQAPWIARLVRSWGPWQVPGDTYLANFWPAALGGPDHLLIAREGTKVWKANPGLREGATWERTPRGPILRPGKGPITAGSVRAVMIGAIRAFPRAP